MSGMSRAAACIDENFFGFEQRIAHLNLVRIRESRPPLVEMHHSDASSIVLLYSAAKALRRRCFSAQRLPEGRRVTFSA